MAKVRFDSLSLQSFNTFKLVPKKRKIKEDSDKQLTNLVEGICVRTNLEYKCCIDAKVLSKNKDLKPDKYPDYLYLEFTEESYNLKGVISVFDRFTNVRYIRNESQCKFFPGNKERLVPFCHNWIVTGYIIRRNGKMMFNFHECIAPKGYNTFVPDEE